MTPDKITEFKMWEAEKADKETSTVYNNNNTLYRITHTENLDSNKSRWDRKGRVNEVLIS